MTESDRHLTRKNFARYYQDGVPVTIPLDGDPKAFFVIEPGRQSISLRVPRDQSGLPNLDEFDAIVAAEVHWNQTNWHQITVTGSAAQDAFALLRDVCDRIQTDGMHLREATNLSLQAFRDLLAIVSRMSKEQEIGLIGELLVLKFLMAEIGTTKALTLWRGWDKAEHDFDLENTDLEVKTTTNEQRLHRISSITQMVPTPERDLWVLSLQITEAAGSANAAFNLSQLVMDILASVNEEDARIDLIGRLRKAKWLERHASLYTSWFRARSEPMFCLVDDDFPALTPQKLEELGLHQSISDVSYVIDLSSSEPSSQAPSLMTKFTEYLTR